MLPLDIITGDCGQLIPPCWQELHYLFGGMLLMLPIALLFYEVLRRWWLRTD
jgi:hypothetical protein